MLVFQQGGLSLKKGQCTAMDKGGVALIPNEGNNAHIRNKWREEDGEVFIAARTWMEDPCPIPTAL